MARRKRWQAALSGLGEGIGNVSQMYLQRAEREHQSDLIAQRQRESDERQATAQLNSEQRQFARTVRQAVAKGELDPAQGSAMLTEAGIPADQTGLESVRPPLGRRMEAILGPEIASATKPEMLPTEVRIGEVGRQQGGFDTSFQGPMPEGEEAMAGFAPEVRSYRAQSQTKRRALESAPTETVTGTDERGRTFTRKMSPSQLVDPFFTSPDASTQGALSGVEESSKQKTLLGDDVLTKLKGETEARILNLVEGLTRQAKVQTAAATAGAAKRATLAPDIVQSEVGRQALLSQGKDQSTDTERRAAANWAPLVNAHAKAQAMEAAGQSIGYGDLAATKSPLLNWAVSPERQQYIQSARDFISTLGLIKSGVTVRPDEVDNMVATLFRTTGDDDRTFKNKTTSREVYLAAMQSMVGRSGEEAGRILATAINQGQIPQTVLQSLQFDNDDLKRALLSNLKGIPQFDLNGNLIGTRPQ